MTISSRHMGPPTNIEGIFAFASGPEVHGLREGYENQDRGHGHRYG